jgi:hypothetical protein
MVMSFSFQTFEDENQLVCNRFRKLILLLLITLNRIVNFTVDMSSFPSSVLLEIFHNCLFNEIPWRNGSASDSKSKDQRCKRNYNLSSFDLND